jgi:hypothetical protein
LDLIDILGCDFGLPFTKLARGYFEPCLCRHMASTEFRVCEGFRQQWPARLRRLHEVFAALADSEAIIPLLSGDEEHLLGFF